MKLRDLMDNAVDETWFCVVTKDGEEHYFWNADYLGGHPSVMPELEPFLDREFDEFDLIIRQDPEKKGGENAENKPMVLVVLPNTENENDGDCKNIIAYEEIKKEADSLRDEFLYVKSVVPKSFVSIYQTSAGWLILDRDALACAPFIKYRFQSVGWTEVISIPDDDIEEAARKIMNIGRYIAVCKLSTGGLNKGHWEITALITSENEIERIKNDGTEEE